MENTDTDKIYGKIYRITSPNTPFAYYGSTTNALSLRLSQHKGQYQQYLQGKTNYMSSVDIIKHGDVTIELISQAFYRNNYELTVAEGKVIVSQNDAINKNIPGGVVDVKKQYAPITSELFDGFII